ncbi:MAG: DNA helicase RecG, partial [Candidatus Kaiserbacteria bacterium]|nr:DNA helicase RecG [Candidatus Kaiserbacteria bacterium]
VEYFKELPINIALITGSGAWKYPSKISRDKPTPISRVQLLKWVGNGEIAMLIGTHALIQKSVKFMHLAYAIVDEQHRFGTKQRRALAHKGDASPHFLSMTATPIPRTLALTMYGDLDLSVLDELPPGRAKITTKIVKPEERADAYERVRGELQKGRQAYVICPRIDEPDPDKWNAVQAKSAKAEAARLQKDVFPEYTVGLLHGSLKPAQKDAVMKAFSEGKIDILVATSVVEVGVNVPNATSIMIEGAERFGLAQLHQLRGRVMRSSHPPFCFLLPETKSDVSFKRLRALEASADGFKLAESDLENRGAGDLYGRKQWGVSDIGMEALKNPRLIEAARTEARALVEADTTLSKHAALRLRVENAGAEIHHE